MGWTHARIRLANARRTGLAAVEVDALADTGALHRCIPEHVAMQLQLDELEKREITIADGSIRLVPYMGGRHPHGGHGPRCSARCAAGRRQSCKPKHRGIDRKRTAAVTM